MSLAGPFCKKYAVTPPSRPGAPTACRRTVSGSISLPSRGAFHLSLTVLCAIGRQWVFSLGGWSPQLPTGFHVSRGTQAAAHRPCSPFAYAAVTLYGGPFQTSSARRTGAARRPQPPPAAPATPSPQRLWAWHG